MIVCSLLLWLIEIDKLVDMYRANWRLPFYNKANHIKKTDSLFLRSLFN